MAHSQTNNVLVYVRMYAVTERGVVGRQVDCSILWLQRLQSSVSSEMWITGHLLKAVSYSERQGHSKVIPRP